MAESYVSDRIIFEKGKQAEFIFACKSRLDLTWISLSKITGVKMKNPLPRYPKICAKNKHYQNCQIKFLKIQLNGQLENH